MAAESSPRAQARVPGLSGVGGSHRLLLAVAVAYTSVQLAVTTGVGIGWDESIYLSQYARERPAIFLSAPRARGISWLTAPIVTVTHDQTAIRLALAIVSGIGLFLAFRPWLRIHPGRLVVPLAAALFAGLWVTLFYGNEAMPNLYVAFASVAAAGFVVQITLAGPSVPALIGATVAVCVAALFRPTDAVFLTCALAACALLFGQSRRREVVAALVGALALGWLPWLVESFVSFGGPIARLRRGAQIQGSSGLSLSLDLSLRSVDGPLLCRPCARSEHPVPLGGLLWWTAATALAGLAVIRDLGAGLAARSVVPATAAIAMTVPYFVGIGYAAPRFLLPTYGLAAVPVALALAWPVRARVPRRLALAGAAAAVGAQLVTQVGVLARQTDAVTADRQRHYDELASAVLRTGLRPPCVVSGSRSIPVSWRTGCAAKQVAGDNGSITVARLRALTAREDVALLVPARQPPPAWAAGWTRIRLDGTRPAIVMYVAGPYPPAWKPRAVPDRRRT